MDSESSGTACEGSVRPVHRSGIACSSNAPREQCPLVIPGTWRVLRSRSRCCRTAGRTRFAPTTTQWCAARSQLIVVCQRGVASRIVKGGASTAMTSVRFGDGWNWQINSPPSTRSVSSTRHVVFHRCRKRACELLRIHSYCSNIVRIASTIRVPGVAG